jgi:hypothetical protein
MEVRDDEDAMKMAEDLGLKELMQPGTVLASSVVHELGLTDHQRLTMLKSVHNAGAGEWRRGMSRAAWGNGVGMRVAIMVVIP